MKTYIVCGAIWSLGITCGAATFYITGHTDLETTVHSCITAIISVMSYSCWIQWNKDLYE